ncbi:MAG: DUF3791 domain-containing protein [Treponema sp.]|nr:DUF3791 domain-containing protein [Candidatus Treponema equifaecale]
MNEEQQILFMQIRLIRMASENLGLTLKQAAELFDKFKVLPFIRDCWGIFHVEGDNAVYEEILEYMISKGAAI